MLQSKQKSTIWFFPLWIPTSDVKNICAQCLNALHEKSSSKFAHIENLNAHIQFMKEKILRKQLQICKCTSCKDKFSKRCADAKQNYKEFHEWKKLWMWSLWLKVQTEILELNQESPKRSKICKKEKTTILMFEL